MEIIKTICKENKSLKERENILQLISDKIDGLTYISAAYPHDAYSDYTNKEGKIKISSNAAKVDVSSLFTNESKAGHSEVFIKLRGTHPKIYLVKLDVPQQDRVRLSGMFAGSFTINSSFKDLQILEAIPSSSKAQEQVNPFTAKVTKEKSTSPEGPYL